MLTCVQFKGSSREMEQQVKQHEARTLNKLSNVNGWLKKSVIVVVAFLKKTKTFTAYRFFSVNTK